VSRGWNDERPDCCWGERPEVKGFWVILDAQGFLLRRFRGDAEKHGSCKRSVEDLEASVERI
jgi:hypothetical protein